MVRLVTKFKYLKSNRKQSAGGYAKYIATREGVEKIDSSKVFAPATVNQQKLIGKLLVDFPDSASSLEYQDYTEQKTVGTAAEFITRTIEENSYEISGRETYAKYIATRPRAEKFGRHGLFTDKGIPVSLSAVQRELNEYQGNIWTVIISLRREDAERLDYNNGARWRDMLRSKTLEMAKNLKINIKNLLAGAKAMDKRCSGKVVGKNPALTAAVLQYLAMKKGNNISVMMPYADSLKLMADWYAQLWGESLGKSVDLDGNKVNVGQTPVKALGVTDQHSQVQLYTEGPFDKVITLIGVDAYRKTVAIPDGCADIPAVNFLCGHTMNELISAEMSATEYALTRSHRLNNKIVIPEVNEYTMGQLMMFFMLQTAYTGALLNIDTFNQPGVEEGKNATYALLGRSGYEEKAKELKSAKQKSEKYVL